MTEQHLGQIDMSLAKASAQQLSPFCESCVSIGTEGHQRSDQLTPGVMARSRLSAVQRVRQSLTVVTSSTELYSEVKVFAEGHQDPSVERRGLRSTEVNRRTLG